MHRIDDPTADTTDPTKPKFTGGDPANSIPSTRVTSKFMNAVQEELASVVEAAGIALDDADDTQVLQALQTMFAGKSEAALLDLLPAGSILGTSETPVATTISTNTAVASVGSVTYTPKRPDSLLRFSLIPGDFVGLNKPSAAEADVAANGYGRININGGTVLDAFNLVRFAGRTASSGDGGTVDTSATSSWFLPVGADLTERTVELAIYSNSANHYIRVGALAGNPTRLLIEELKR